MSPDTAPDRPVAPQISLAQISLAQISLAVIGLVGGAATEKCRAALDGQAGLGRAGVITIPQTGAVGDTIPARRLRALDQTDGALLALIEDTTRVDPGWLAAVLDGFRDPGVGAVWGPVRIAPDLGARFRALGRMEYGRFDRSAAIGLPGNCMTFRRSALLAALPPEPDATRAGITEHQVAARMQAQGWTILFAPEAGVRYAAADRYGARLSTRFGHGRLYAATSPARHSPAGRALGAAKALLLPAVLTLRALRPAVAAAPPRLWLAEAPWIMLMALAWGLGELTGHLFGIGQSERTWR